MTPPNAAHFFETARERYRIMIRRQMGEPRPWTTDPVLQNWRFCCVHREDDRTTRWFREHLRDRLCARFRTPGFAQLSGDLLCHDWVSLELETVFAVLAFRWFNRIETAEVLGDLLMGASCWEPKRAREILRSVSPVTNAAYIVSAPAGLSKADGIVEALRMAWERIPRFAEGRQPHEHLWSTLEEAHASLRTLPFVGRFIAFEVVTDLRWTPVLHHASDINTWASAGPGAARGISWVLYDNNHSLSYSVKKDQDLMLGVMQQLLELSKDQRYWPQDWRPWEMREVEHWSCEYDKIRRAMNGERLKRRFM